MKTELKVPEQIDKLFHSAVLHQSHFYLSSERDDIIFKCQLKVFRSMDFLHFISFEPSLQNFFLPPNQVFCTSSTGSIYFTTPIASCQEQGIIVQYPPTVFVQYIRAFPRYFCLDKKINLQFTFSDLHFHGIIEDISAHGARISFQHQLHASELLQKDYVQIRSIGEMLLVPTLKAQIAYLQTQGCAIIACGLFIENDYPFNDLKEFFDLKES